MTVASRELRLPGRIGGPPPHRFLADAHRPTVRPHARAADIRAESLAAAQSLPQPRPTSASIFSNPTRLASRPPTLAMVAVISLCTISVDFLGEQLIRFACAGFDKAEAGLGGRSLAGERVLDLRGAAREAGERRSVEAFCSERRHQAAHARAGVAGVLVGGIAHERNSSSSQ